jgi:hypothetical protein
MSLSGVENTSLKPGQSAGFGPLSLLDLVVSRFQTLKSHPKPRFFSSLLGHRSGGLIELVGPGVDDGIFVEVVHGSHEALARER